MKKQVTIRKLKKIVWKDFSMLIRQRDKGVCFTCGSKKHWKEQQAGHYIPTSVCEALRFEGMNFHTQCYRCNINLSGNVIEYRKRLVAEYGLEEVEKLEARKYLLKKWTRAELFWLRDSFKELLKVD